VALTEITPSRVRALIAEKLNGRACAKHDRPSSGCETCVAPLSRNTVKNIVATLRAVLYQAQVDELIRTTLPPASAASSTPGTIRESM
jgi:hypothetical protein